MAVKIVKNDFSDRIKKASSFKPEQPFREIEIQWRKENNIRFKNEEYADDRGNVTPWVKGLSNATLIKHNKKKTKAGEKKLLIDTARLVNSLFGGQHKDAISLITNKFLEIGTRVIYAIYHHLGKGRQKKRPILTISGGDKEKFKKIFTMYMKGEF